MTAHNKKLLKVNNSIDETSEERCNCRSNCPVQGKCKTKCVVYKATITDPANTAEYIGCNNSDFKTRYNNHKSNFRSQNQKKQTSLASFVWNRNLGPEPNISWQIIKKCKIYEPSATFCGLCNTEKTYILKNLHNPININKRSDIGNRCIRRNKYKLMNIK